LAGISKEFLVAVAVLAGGVSCRERRAEPPVWNVLAVQVPVTDHPVPMPNAANPDSLHIAIKGGKVYLGSNVIPSDALAAKVKDRITINPATEVYLWADKSTSYDHFTDVWEDLRAAGVNQVGLITERQEHHDSPMGEEVLVVLPPPPDAKPSLEQYKPLFDHGHLVSPPAVPKVCRAGSPIFVVIYKEHQEKGVGLCTDDLTWEQLPGRLTDLGSRVIFIHANGDVNLGYVAKAVDIGHSAGAEKVGLITRRAESGQ
jgi:biopolymer transport protein ExbD